MKLVAQSARGRNLKPQRSSAAVEAAYRKRLDAEIAAMHRSVVWWVRAAYKKEDHPLAQDRNPATIMRQLMDRLTRKWRDRFAKLSDDMAKRFVDGTFRHGDTTLRTALKDAGLTVQFRPTMAVKNAMTAAVAENVDLIKSIPERHLASINTMVMQAVTTGRDLGTLTQGLQDQFGVTRRRAANIARDQANKASAAITRTRTQELGLTEAIWRHSNAGKHPRQSHLEADGKRYKIAEGMVLDGERVWPGTAIGCRCYSVPFLPGFDD